MKERRIVLGVTGSIAAYKAAEIIRRLQDQGVGVSVIMTKGAEEFITPLTLATLSGEKAHRQMFDQDQSEWNIHHLSLAERAEALLIAPATANVISKIACGLADDLLTSTALATEAPILIAPAMNERMFLNKIFQENCQKLQKHGVHFIHPVKGRLACGQEGEGHLADVEHIVKAVLEALKMK